MTEIELIAADTLATMQNDKGYNLPTDEKFFDAFVDALTKAMK